MLFLIFYNDIYEYSVPLQPTLSRRRRPVYNNAMKDQVICFTGFNERSQISQLASLVHYMNGTIRKDYSPNVTHVVANHCKGEKYKVSFVG